MATTGSAWPPILRLTSGVLLGMHYHIKHKHYSIKHHKSVESFHIWIEFPVRWTLNVYLMPARACQYERVYVADVIISP